VIIVVNCPGAVVEAGAEVVGEANEVWLLDD
jgi:hypothetical protein